MKTLKFIKVVLLSLVLFSFHHISAQRNVIFYSDNFNERANSNEFFQLGENVEWTDNYNFMLLPLYKNDERGYLYRTSNLNLESNLFAVFPNLTNPLSGEFVESDIHKYYVLLNDYQDLKAQIELAYNYDAVAEMIPYGYVSVNFEYIYFNHEQNVYQSFKPTIENSALYFYSKNNSGLFYEKTTNQSLTSNFQTFEVDVLSQTYLPENLDSKGNPFKILGFKILIEDNIDSYNHLLALRDVYVTSSQTELNFFQQQSESGDVNNIDVYHESNGLVSLGFGSNKNSEYYYVVQHSSDPEPSISHMLEKKNGKGEQPIYAQNGNINWSGKKHMFDVKNLSLSTEYVAYVMLKEPGTTNFVKDKVIFNSDADRFFPDFISEPMISIYEDGHTAALLMELNEFSTLYYALVKDDPQFFSSEELKQLVLEQDKEFLTGVLDIRPDSQGHFKLQKTFINLMSESKYILYFVLEDKSNQLNLMDNPIEISFITPSDISPPYFVDANVQDENPNVINIELNEKISSDNLDGFTVFVADYEVMITHIEIDSEVNNILKLELAHDILKRSGEILVSYNSNFGNIRDEKNFTLPSFDSKIVKNMILHYTVENLSQARGLVSDMVPNPKVKIKGQGYLFGTIQSTDGMKVFIQDANAGIRINDSNLEMSEKYKVGDGIIDISGTLVHSKKDGVLELNLTNMGKLLTENNNVMPLVLNSYEYNQNPEKYESRYLRFNDVKFDMAGEKLNPKINYKINQFEFSILWNDIFLLSDMQTIPFAQKDITGIGSRNASEFVINLFSNSELPVLDSYQPTFIKKPMIVDIKHDSFIVKSSISEPGTCYYVVNTFDEDFDLFKILTSPNYKEYKVENHNDINIVIEGLSYETDYYVHMIFKDDVGNIQPNSTKLKVHTGLKPNDADTKILALDSFEAPKQLYVSSAPTKVLAFRVQDSGFEDQNPTFISNIVINAGSGNDLDWTKAITSASLIHDDGEAIQGTISSDKISFKLLDDKYFRVEDGNFSDFLMFVTLGKINDGATLSFSIPKEHSFETNYQIGSGFEKVLSTEQVSFSYSTNVVATKFVINAPDQVFTLTDFSILIMAVDEIGNVDTAPRKISISVSEGDESLLSSIDGLGFVDMEFGHFRLDQVRYNDDGYITFHVFDASESLIESFSERVHVINSEIITDNLNSFKSIFQNLSVGSKSIPSSYILSCHDLVGNTLSIQIIEGFEISLSPNFELEKTGNSSKPLLIPVIDGSIIEKIIYVRFSPNRKGEFTGDIVHSALGASTKRVRISGVAVEGVITDTEDFVNSSYYVYPNPVQNQFKLVLPEDGYENNQLKILDVTGVEVMDTNMSRGGGEVDVSTLKKGLYILNFRIKDRIINHRILVN